MLALALTWLVAVAPDGGLSREQQQRAYEAYIECEDSDAGTWVKQFGDCVVTCRRGTGALQLVDAGSCFGKIVMRPAPAGDFWLPGQWPYSASTPMWPLTPEQ